MTKETKENIQAAIFTFCVVGAFMLAMKVVSHIHVSKDSRTATELYGEYVADMKVRNQPPLSFDDWWNKNKTDK